MFCWSPNRFHNSAAVLPSAFGGSRRSVEQRLCLTRSWSFCDEQYLGPRKLVALFSVRHTSEESRLAAVKFHCVMIRLCALRRCFAGATRQVTAFDGSWRPITTAIFEVMRHFSLLTVCAQSKFGALSAPQALSAAPFDRRGEN